MIKILPTPFKIGDSTVRVNQASFATQASDITVSALVQYPVQYKDVPLPKVGEHAAVHNCRENGRKTSANDLRQTLGQTLKQGLLILTSLLLILLFLTDSVEATSIYDFPSTLNFDQDAVIDQANVLSPITESQIKDKLKNLAKETTEEVYFVTIDRVEFVETAQGFAEGLFEQWFSTPQVGSDKIVIVVDTLTETSGIKVGKAGEALLDQVTAQSVANETLLTPVRNGSRYNQAAFDVVDRLTPVLSGLPDPGPPTLEATVSTERTYATAEETEESNATAIVIVLLIVATIVPMATYFAYVLR